MTTTVTVTGTGMPPIEPGRAGAGCLVQYEDPASGRRVALQFDAGRATALRLAEAGQHPAYLDAVFLTHHHSDHLTGIVDLVFCAWLNRPDSRNLSFVAPDGPCTRFLERMLIPYEEDIDVRIAHTGRAEPGPAITGFEPTYEPQVVWEDADVGVRVLSRTVEHHPVDPAVGYKIETPDGSAVISGDTVICDQIEDFAKGCDVLVHEAFFIDLFVEQSGDEKGRVIGDYHTDTPALGKMCARAEPAALMITHMAPPPKDEDDKQRFVVAVRDGGFEGPVIVCDDLDSLSF